MLKLYGTSMSSAGRCLWVLEELGLRYEHIPTAIADTRQPAHLKLNPNGHIPVLEDDGLVLFESMAINLYLVDKYGRDSLWPASTEDRGRAYQWSFWAVTELEPHLIVMIRQEMFTPPEQCDSRAIEAACEALVVPLKVLDGHLRGRDYILGSKFTIADLNVAGVLLGAPLVGYDTSPFPAVTRWFEKCVSREAHQRNRSRN
jgi:glutathione S-transferase